MSEIASGIKLHQNMAMPWNDCDLTTNWWLTLG